MSKERTINNETDVIRCSRDTEGNTLNIRLEEEWLLERVAKCQAEKHNLYDPGIDTSQNPNCE